MRILSCCDTVVVCSTHAAVDPDAMLEKVKEKQGETDNGSADSEFLRSVFKGGTSAAHADHFHAVPDPDCCWAFRGCRRHGHRDGD